MNTRSETSQEMISHHTSGGFLFCITSLSALFPLTGLRIMVMQHHMLCEELCADDPTMECPVKLNFLDVQAFELLWLPALLAVCVVLIATFLIRGVTARPALTEMIKSDGGASDPVTPEAYLSQGAASTALDLSMRHHEEPEDHIDMPVRARRVRLKKPQKRSPVKLQMSRYRTYPYDWMIERDARLAEKGKL